jgi:Caspase domain
VIVRALCLAAVGLGLAGSAHAQRFAVVIGNNAGRAEEGLLEFAERDASRVAETLTQVGGVRAERLVLAQGGSASAARQAVIAINERIRTEASGDSMLIVYYSGHSDAEALHLGNTSLSLAELESLVRGSAARVRVLIVDACRSGALTRRKGGRPAPSIRIESSRLRGDGVIVLTASAADEDAQESPALEGSFFTHHLVSAMLGAADEDGDGRVTISEAYDYAYANTLRDSSATLAGTQHPSYRYDLRGQGEVTFTEVRPRGGRAQLVIPSDLDVLVLRGSANGAVLAEARTRPDAPGSLSLPPGKIFIRARTARALFEGALLLRDGQTSRLDLDDMDRIELARLARKGGTHVPFVAGVGLAAQAHAGLADRDSLCPGAALHGSFVYRQLSLAPRVLVCREDFDDDRLSTKTTETQLSLALNVHRDLGRVVSAYLGPEVGVSYFRQHVQPRLGFGGSRNIFGGALSLQGGVELDLGGALSLGVRALAQTYFLELENPTQPRADVSAVFTWGLSLGLTRYLR